MSTQLKLRRGTTAQHSTFTGAAGEITVDTDKKTVVVHDGSTAGGNPLATAATPTFSGNVTLSSGTANGVAYLNGSKVLTTGSALTFDGTTLNFGGTAQRITGDFSNTTVANRVAFQTNTTNGNTIFSVLPNGTAVGSHLRAYNNSDPTNGAFVAIRASGPSAILESSISGTGTYLPLVFNTDGSEQMRLTSTGLGIGTSSPSTPLHIKSASVAQARFENNYNSAFYVGISGDTTGNALFYNSANTATLFYNNGAEKMRLDSSGNLGLGVTPKSWDAGWSAIDFGGNSIISGNSTMSVALNAYRAGTNWIYKNTAAASNYYQSSGAHYWYTAPSGTAGNAISFTQAMTLDASGRLLLGTTSAYDISPAGTGQYGSIQAWTSSSDNINASFIHYSNDTAGPAFPLIKTRGTTAGSNVAVNSGDSLGNFLFRGADGTRYLNGGFINCITDAAASTNSLSAYMSFATNGGSSFATERMRIDSSGNVGIGTSSPAANTRLTLSDANSIKLRLTNGSVQNGIFFDAVTATNSYYIGAGKELAVGSDKGFMIWDATNSRAKFYCEDTVGETRVLGTTFQTFYTNGLERMRIDSSGNTMIGRTSAEDNTGVGAVIYNTGNIVTTYNTAGSVNTFHLYNINATNNGYRFYVNVNGGISNYSGNNVNLSDERTKANIELSGNYLDKICAIPVKLFNYKDEAEGEQKTLGVIAQDVEAVAPEFVNTDGWEGKEPDDGVPMKSIYTTDMMFALMKAIQELKAELDATKAEVAALKGV